MATHVHLVVNSATDRGPRLLQLFKGAASRDLNRREQGFGDRWWTKSGSRRLLTSVGSIEGAVRYVLCDQEGAFLIFGDRAG